MTHVFTQIFKHKVEVNNFNCTNLDLFQSFKKLVIPLKNQIWMKSPKYGLNVFEVRP